MSETDSTEDSAEIPSENHLKSKIKHCFNAMNVEPVIYLGAVVFGIVLNIWPLFLIWSRCIQIYDKKIENVHEYCNDMAYYRRITDNVEMDVANWLVYQQIAGKLPAVIVAPLISAWSDRSAGRKLPLIFSLIAYIIATFVMLLTTKTVPYINVYYGVMTAQYIIGFSGCQIISNAASYAMITDEARDKKGSYLSKRMAIACALTGLGILTGDILSWLCRFVIQGHADSYFAAIFIGLVLTVLALIYTVLFVRETYEPFNEIPEEPNESSRYINCYAICNSVKEFFQVMSSERTGWRRFCLNLVVVLMVLEFMAEGCRPFVLLFVKRDPLNWTDVSFTIFNMFVDALATIGMYAGPAIASLTRIIWTDSLMILIGVAFTAVRFIVFSLSFTTLMVYMGGSLSLISFVLIPGYNSFVPKLVKKEETARLFTFLGVITGMVPIVSTMLFTKIFEASLDFFPGLVFLIAAGIQVVVFLGQIVVDIFMLRSYKEEMGDSDILVENDENNTIS